MQKLIIVVIASLALAAASPGEPKNPLPKPEDRQRETDWKLQDPAVLRLLHREKIYENSDHRFDGTALLQRDLSNKMNPTQLGARVDYQNIPSNTKVGVEALNAGRFGTEVGAEATRNLFHGRNSDLDVGLNYKQRFGGLGGRSEPSFGGFVRATF